MSLHKQDYSILGSVCWGPLILGKLPLKLYKPLCNTSFHFIVHLILHYSPLLGVFSLYILGRPCKTPQYNIVVFIFFSNIPCIRKTKASRSRSRSIQCQSSLPESTATENFRDAAGHQHFQTVKGFGSVKLPCLHNLPAFSTDLSPSIV